MALSRFDFVRVTKYFMKLCPNADGLKAPDRAFSKLQTTKTNPKWLTLGQYAAHSMPSLSRQIAMWTKETIVVNVMANWICRYEISLRFQKESDAIGISEIPSSSFTPTFRSLSRQSFSRCFAAWRWLHGVRPGQTRFRKQSKVALKSESKLLGSFACLRLRP
jgi:hypothetical protein